MVSVCLCLHMFTLADVYVCECVLLSHSFLYRTNETFWTTTGLYPQHFVLSFTSPVIIETVEIKSANSKYRQLYMIELFIYLYVHISGYCFWQILKQKELNRENKIYSHYFRNYTNLALDYIYTHVNQHVQLTMYELTIAGITSSLVWDYVLYWWKEYLSALEY